MSLPITDLDVNTLTRVKVFVYILTDLTDIYMINSFYNLFLILCSRNFWHNKKKYILSRAQRVKYPASTLSCWLGTGSNAWPVSLRYHETVRTWRPAPPSRGRPAPSSRPPGTSSCSWSAPSPSPAARPERPSAARCTDGDTPRRQEWVFLVLSYWGKIPISWKL